MSVARNDDRVTAVKRQLRAVRTEVEVAADVLVRLFDSGMLVRSPRMVADVCTAVGLPVDAVRRAKDRADRLGYRPPFATSTIAVVPERKTGDDESARHSQWAQAEGARKGGQATSKQAPAYAVTYQCAKCGETKPIVDNFPHRADAPHRRWTVCNACRKARQRRYYLTSAKGQALEKARVTFTAGPEGVGLVCADCGAAFTADDTVWGETQIRHAHCPVSAS